jgi:hypothetical protein
MRLAHSRTWLALPLVALCLAAAPASAQDKLSAEDRKVLERALKTTLYDPPVGAQRCRFKLKVRTVWGQQGLVEREGWALRNKAGQTEVRLADGWLATDPQQVQPFDFAKGCALLVQALQAQTQPPPQASREHPLALAGWCLRAGDEGLAAVFLDMARQEFAAIKARAPKEQLGQLKLEMVLRGHLTWQAYSGMVHAFMVRADAEAEAYAKHLQARYADEVKGTQVALILEDLARRRAAGTFGKTPTTTDVRKLQALPVAARVPAAVAALDEIDARQLSQPGGVDLASDPRLAALIDCKEAAVPALLEVLEKDRRLTRSVHFWRDFNQDRTVLSVAEAALVALQSILRIRVFEPRSTGDNFTIRGPKASKLAAEKLREYWKANRGVSLPERLRRSLTRTQGKPADWRRAATELGRLGRDRRIGTTLGGDQVSERKGDNPALALANPTAAEAILAALDRDVAQHLESKRYTDLRGDELRELEALYFDALVRLGDERIAPALAKRAAQAKRSSLRRLLAVACRGLGDGAPLDALAADFAQGKVALGKFEVPETPFEQTPGAVELDACVQTFTQMSTGGVASCDSALYALADPKHPSQAHAVDLIWTKAGPEGGLWVRHPWHLRLLASQLQDTAETGRVYRLELVEAKGRQPKHWAVVVEEQGKEIARQPISPEAGPVARLKRVAERRCDRAATAISVRLLGTPTYDLLVANRDERLAELRAYCARFLPAIQRASALEVATLRLGPNPFGVFYRPGVGLSQAATDADLAAGRALFVLPGGQPIQTVLPAVTRYLKSREPALVLQAEVAKGQVRLAVLTGGAFLAVGLDQVSEPRPIPKPADQRAAAISFLKFIAANQDERASDLITANFRQALVKEKATKRFFNEFRQALRQTPRERLIEGLAPGFGVQADGSLRWEP